MYTKAVQYRGVWLAPGSTSLQLYEAKAFKQLDAHLEKCKAAALALQTPKDAR